MRSPCSETNSCGSGKAAHQRRVERSRAGLAWSGRRGSNPRLPPLARRPGPSSWCRSALDLGILFGWLSGQTARICTGEQSPRKWSCAGPARAFVDGYADNWPYEPYRMFIDGDSTTSPACWSIQDVYYTAYARTPNYPLPTIYFDKEPCNWTHGDCRGFGVERTVGFVAFQGVMTQCQNPDPIPFGNFPREPVLHNAARVRVGNNGPGQAWQRLWDAEKVYYPQSSMKYATNIKFQPTG